MNAKTDPKAQIAKFKVGPGPISWELALLGMGGTLEVVLMAGPWMSQHAL